MCARSGTAGAKIPGDFCAINPHICVIYIFLRVVFAYYVEYEYKFNVKLVKCEPNRIAASRNSPRWSANSGWQILSISGHLAYVSAVPCLFLNLFVILSKVLGVSSKQVCAFYNFTHLDLCTKDKFYGNSIYLNKLNTHERIFLVTTRTRCTNNFNFSI